MFSKAFASLGKAARQLPKTLELLAKELALSLTNKRPTAEKVLRGDEDLSQPKRAGGLQQARSAQRRAPRN